MSLIHRVKPVRRIPRDPNGISIRETFPDETERSLAALAEYRGIARLDGKHFARLWFLTWAGVDDNTHILVRTSSWERYCGVVARAVDVQAHRRSQARKPPAIAGKRKIRAAK